MRGRGDVHGRGQGCVYGRGCVWWGRGMHGRGPCVAGGMHGRGACLAVGCAWWRECMAGKTAIAGGTHPTGMHSCLLNDYNIRNKPKVNCIPTPHGLAAPSDT